MAFEPLKKLTMEHSHKVVPYLSGFIIMLYYFRETARKWISQAKLQQFREKVTLVTFDPFQIIESIISDKHRSSLNKIIRTSGFVMTYGGCAQLRKLFLRQKER